jgi:signal transduction histidine kinase
LKTPEKFRHWGRGLLRVRLGLQIRCVLIVMVLVWGVAFAAEWLHWTSMKNLLAQSDRGEAERILQSIELLCPPKTALAGENNSDGRKLPPELLRALHRLGEDSNVVFVALVGPEGRVIAHRNHSGRDFAALLALPVSVVHSRLSENGFLHYARPLLTGDKSDVYIAGRVVLDRAHSRSRLAAARRRLRIVTYALCVCLVPLGYLLVWRVVLHPISRLGRMASRMASGDLAVRSGLRRRDELGDLGNALDRLASRLSRARGELLAAQQRLQGRVDEATQDLQRTNRRLREEMEQKEQFLRAVSHDLNAPLRNISGTASMLDRKYGEQLPEEIRRRIRRIQDNVSTGEEMISELLEISRLRERPAREQEVDFNELLAELREQFRDALAERRIELLVRGRLPVLRVDRGRMRQVFQNLIDNAVKYMHREEGGRIEVSCRSAGGVHRFDVQDNGPGIAPDQQKRIFAVFQRVQNEATSQIHGKGLGLALVANAVSAYDGRAWVESRPGEGACFCFTLESVEDLSPAPPPRRHRRRSREDEDAEAESQRASSSAGDDTI